MPLAGVEIVKLPFRFRPFSDIQSHIQLVTVFAPTT